MKYANVINKLDEMNEVLSEFLISPTKRKKLNNYYDIITDSASNEEKGEFLKYIEKTIRIINTIPMTEKDFNVFKSFTDKVEAFKSYKDWWEEYVY